MDLTPLDDIVRMGTCKAMQNRVPRIHRQFHSYCRIKEYSRANTLPFAPAISSRGVIYSMHVVNLEVG